MLASILLIIYANWMRMVLNKEKVGVVREHPLQIYIELIETFGLSKI